MKSFPLVRIRWSNEHIMTAVFFVTLLYLVPSWIKNPLEFLYFLIILTVALVIDVAANLLRHKQPACAVSAAITSGVLTVLTPVLPLWARIAGVAIAIIIGKHSFGGTGKNIFNPAIFTLFFLSLFFKIDFTLFRFSFWLIPAIILSLPFIFFRVYAGIGLMLGMILLLAFSDQLTLIKIFNYGIIFWSCLVITDPVTTSPYPIEGFFLGFITGFVPLFFFGTMQSFAFTYLISNLIWYVLIKNDLVLRTLFFHKSRLKKIFLLNNELKSDDSSKKYINDVTIKSFTKEEILSRIEKNEVYGLGGAGFPSIEKINMTINSIAKEKFLIVNGAQCDPGLLHDGWIMGKFSNEILKSIELLRICIDFNEVFIALKKNAGYKFPSGIKPIKIEDYYPAGYEKYLIKKILKRNISEDTVPALDGILILNIQTIYAIHQAVYFNQKTVSKYITVSNINEKKAEIIQAALGDKIIDIADKIFPGYNNKFTGGGFMQSRVADESDVVDRKTNFISVSDFPYFKESLLCSRCGLCNIYCPQGLNAGKIYELADMKKIDKVKKYNPEKCIECGNCSYICLAGRNISAKVKKAKDGLKIRNLM